MLWSEAFLTVARGAFSVGLFNFRGTVVLATSDFADADGRVRGFGEVPPAPARLSGEEAGVRWAAGAIDGVPLEWDASWSVATANGYWVAVGEKGPSSVNP